MSVPAVGPLQTFALAHETLREIRTAGARRSEIKGEPWAQPRAEDIRGGGHPLAPAGAMQERAAANDRNGPRAEARFMRRGSREARWSD
jgi:hypothetical protein